LRTSSSSIRQHLLVRIALALAVACACVSVAGVLASRQQAGQRLDDQAAAAKSVFDDSLTLWTRRVRTPDERARALELAAADAARATGAQVTLGSPTAAGKRYRYAIGGGRELTVVVSTRPVAKATVSALVIGLGIGAGVLLLLVSLMLAPINRAVAAPPAEVDDEPAPPAGSEPPDAVTNNHQFHESLGIELKRAERERTPLGLVVLDVDGFGSTSDAHDRAFGDELLDRVTHELRQMMRATDLFCRLGGDDFALILPGADGQLAAAIAERARKAVAAASTDDRHISCSAGVASYPEDARDGATLLQLATGALRWAKSNGRGQTKRFDPKDVALPTDHQERAEIETLLGREHPIIPFFQPLVSLSTGRILGYEALSRFPHPPGRGPDAWFAQAARSGLAAPLEAAALHAALSKEGRPAGTFLSLNVSPSTLGSPEVQAVLPEDMADLVVEITEHDLAEDLDALEQVLSALRERGARIAIDDAGTGYSGLQRVMRIQPDVIKLDRELVMNVHEDSVKEALIDSFVRFAHRTGASVCAEGVETMEELKLLADLDVTYGQGYVLARPAPDWQGVPKPVSESLLRWSLRSQGDVARKTALPESGDQRLEYVSARISKLHTVSDLQHVFELIAQEVGADAICVSRWIRGSNLVETLIDTDGEDTGTCYNLASYASTAHVLNTGEAMQVLASDPCADLGELSLLGQLGFRRLLMVPVVCHDERLGLLEAYGKAERPWTRSEINRARIIAYQLGAVLDGLERVQSARLLSSA
jgi:diguanylate cyclase (GGDEF)-like protein